MASSIFLLSKIVSESALASGVRRIEAITGNEALAYVNDSLKKINAIKENLKCNIEDIDNKINDLILSSKENLNLVKKIEGFKLDSIFLNISPISDNSNIKVFNLEIDDAIDPKNFVDKFSRDFNTKAMFLLGIKQKKPMIILAISKDITSTLNAGKIIKDIVTSIGGGGGGPPHFGTAGFNDIKKYNKAYKLVLTELRDLMND